MDKLYKPAEKAYIALQYSRVLSHVLFFIANEYIGAIQGLYTDSLVSKMETGDDGMQYT